ncbi:MAG: glycosyltransferase family 4 protein [Candidatus Sulfotelmatobacter sp.]
MRILWVKAGKLLPVDTGGKIRSYNILKKLAHSHDVTLLSYYGGDRDSEYEEAIVQEFPAAKTIFTAAPESTLAQSVDYLRRLFQSAPFAVSKFTHRRVQRSLSELLESGAVDVAVCDFLSASQNFPEVVPTPTVLFQHNVETALWRRMASTESNPIKRIAYKIEAAKMERQERSALHRFRYIVAVSEHDRELMLEMNRNCTISVVPTGVDTQKYAVAPPAQAKPPRIVFTGSMDWEPNIDAVGYFCEQILPPVLSEFPETVFQIVGRNPHPKVKRLASESVQVTGTVPSVADYLRDATVVIVPLRMGGGTRLKIFEAMAMGKAMVSTSVGAEGLRVQSGRDLILADSPSEFSEAILLLVRDDAVRRRYEQAGAELATQFDWSRIALKFADVLQDAVRNFHVESGLGRDVTISQ